MLGEHTLWACAEPRPFPAGRGKGSEGCGAGVRCGKGASHAFAAHSLDLRHALLPIGGSGGEVVRRNALALPSSAPQRADVR